MNKVVLLISTTWAREEELISEISGCCLCLASLGPQRHTAEWILLDYILADPVRPLGVWSGASPLPSSLSVPRGKRGKITQPQLTTGLSWCSFKQASPHTMNIQGQQVDHPRSVKARFKPPCKQDITLEQDTESPAALGVLSSISTRPLTSLWSRRGQNILGKIWKKIFFFIKKNNF